MEDDQQQQDLLLEDVEKAIEALGGSNAVLNLQELAGNPTDCAKVQMGLAFAINSLFYCKLKAEIFVHLYFVLSSLIKLFGLFLYYDSDYESLGQN